MIDFAILSLPRSGSTWLANFFTTERSLCLHDPFNALPEDWPRGGRRLGISCTGAYLMPKWLGQQRCPVAVIERELGECNASLARLGQSGCDELKPCLDRVNGRRFAFDSLWAEAGAKRLWKFLLPGIPFDAVRYRLLEQMRIEPHAKWKPNLSVAAELQRRGLLEN